MSWPWSQLGLPGPSGLSEVRHAYAEKLKTTHPEEDPEGFQRLHSAYQLASRMARQQKRQGAVRAPEPQTERERPAPPSPEREDSGGINFDELLDGEGEQPRRPREEDGEPDFDFDELLDGEGEQPRRPREEDGEPDFDFDELLNEEGEQPHPPEEEEEPDFDFDRLFAEGEAERAEARRRRGEERRKAQERLFQERQRQWKNREERLNLRFRQEEERWQGTETILHTIEMMYNARAGAEEWQKFFQSPLFQQNKGTLDLIFGLEDFISAKSLPQEVKLALFLAYGFDKGLGRPELRPLYQMLLPAWKAEQGSKSRQRISQIFGGLGGVVGLIVIGMILTSNYLPGFIILGGLTVYGLTKGWFKREAKNLNGRRKRNWYRVCFAVGMVIAAVLMILRLPGMWDRVEVLLPTRDPREQTCRYIKQDLGVEVGSIYNRNEQYATEENGNLFYLEPDTSKVFLAGPNGEREGANTGYVTNLPEMMLLWELKDFAKAHKLSPVDSLDQNLERYETGGTFLITLPEEDGETVIEDLGTLLEGLREEKWYKALPSQCELVLCSREMEEGRLVLIRVHPAAEVYSVPQIQGLYEDGFAHAVCAQIIRELELDRDFLREEDERYTMTGEGVARLKDRDCYKLYGLNEAGAVAMEYYVDLERRNIYCVPGNFWETGNTEDQINFYRLLYWGERGTFSLFYPWLRVN